MQKQTLQFLGCDSGFGESNNSAYMIVGGCQLILIDCGYTTFNTLRKKLPLKDFFDISIIITHLHPDHAGSLGQLIMYLGYVLKKKPTIISACEHIRDFLDIVGVNRDLYTLATHSKRIDWNVDFIKTIHAPELDCYGFRLYFNSFGTKYILYTGDTAILEPFKRFFPSVSNIVDKSLDFYVDVSKFGGVHLQIDKILPELVKLQEKCNQVYLMHIDDKEYIANAIKGTDLKIVKC